MSAWISWRELVWRIEKIQKFPYGNGTEIFFDYKGERYVICSHRESCDIQKCSDSFHLEGETDGEKEPVYTYKTLAELGEASDIGFSVKECWEDFDEIHTEPSFRSFTLDEILAAQRESYEKWKENHPGPQRQSVKDKKKKQKHRK